MNTLAVLVAKSGVALWGNLPGDWETVVVDYSRLDLRGVDFWSLPSQRRFDQIFVIDRGVVTGLTQRKVERALRKLGVEGPILFAGQAKALLGFHHQAFIINPEGILVPRAQFEPPACDEYLLALVGLPATGKTMVRKILEGLAGFSSYKWGATAAEVIAELYGDCTMESVARFTREVEDEDKVYLAREFLACSGVTRDLSRFAVVDGIKRREQIIFVSYALKRPVIVVKVIRDEKERSQAARDRGDFDDKHDAVRLELLRAMGALEMANFADFIVDITGSAVVYDEGSKSCTIRLTERFLSGFHEILSWLYLSISLEETREIVAGRCQQIAEDAGYKTKVEVRK